MKNHFLLIFLLLPFTGFSQSLTIDTIIAYEAGNIINTISGGDTICNIDGKDYPPSYCARFWFENDPLLVNDDEHPKLHFTKMYNMKGELLYTTYMIDIEVQNFGPYRAYYPDGKLKVKGQYLFFGMELKPYLIYGNHNCKTGKWKYYLDSGELYKTEFYCKNKLIKEKYFVDMNSLRHME